MYPIREVRAAPCRFDDFDPAPDDTLALPEPNPFVPGDLGLIDARAAEPWPTRIISRPGFDPWHHADVEFGQPRANFYFVARSPIANDSPRHAVPSALLTRMANDALNEFAYPATLAGQTHALHRHRRRITVRLSGWGELRMLDVPGLAPVIQSPSTLPEALHQHVDSFLHRSGAALRGMPPAVFERHRAAVERARSRWPIRRIQARAALLRPIADLRKIRVAEPSIRRDDLDHRARVRLRPRVSTRATLPGSHTEENMVMTTHEVPTTMTAPSHAPVPSEDDAPRVERALEWLSRNFERQPSLAEAAGHAGLSEYHFQRLFRRQVGLSPKKYVQFLTLERAKDILAQSRSVLDAAYASGLSGPGRLHDLFVNVEAMTPGEYKHRGRGLTIRYGVHPSPFGQCLIMRTARGVCGLAFTSPARRCETFAELARGFEAATFIEDAGATAGIARTMFGEPDGGGDLTLHLRGTPFRIKIWRALLAIPPGCVTSYGDLAHRIGAPGASRAAGNAIASNPVAWIIPCHRVIRASGILGQYRWGRGRKLTMLSLEAGGAASGPGRTVSIDR